MLFGYTEHIENTLKINPYNYWKFIKNNRSNSKVPKELFFNCVTSTNEQESVELFSTYICSIFFNKLIDIDTFKLSIYSFDLLNNVHFTVNDVFNRLSILRGI